MNVFILHENPDVNAKYHIDKHVVKMIIEEAQLLCSAHWVSGGEAPYKLTHKNHPCSIWTRESLSNYNYLCDCAVALCEEYTFRYGKKHKTEDVINWCCNNKPNINDIGLTEPAKAMPDEYKCDSVIDSYRKYYMGEKRKFASWKNRNKPEWFI